MIPDPAIDEIREICHKISESVNYARNTASTEWHNKKLKRGYGRLAYR